ncbi:MAG: ABC transporter ATP-binding protein [Clostridiales bacterium]|nr:ABC transporter ATP-binding protein [Clostridiales bacterium]
MVLQVSNLVKKYGNTVALRGVNLNLPEGRIVGLLGPNGSGKTTLIKILAGILTIDGGMATICDNEIGVKTKALVSYLPDKSFLCEWMSVEKMLNYTKDFFPDFRLERAMEMVKMLGINPKSRIKTLSKGTKEKVSLIIAMSRDAKLYLLDEPIAGVDPAARDYVIRTIINNYSPNSTVIISTHLISDVEPILSDFVFINNGQIVLAGNVDDTRIREQKSIDHLFREVFRC